MRPFTANQGWLEVLTAAMKEFQQKQAELEDTLRSKLATSTGNQFPFLGLLSHNKELSSLEFLIKILTNVNFAAMHLALIQLVCL
jgi:hypothetical protein